MPNPNPNEAKCGAKGSRLSQIRLILSFIAIVITDSVPSGNPQFSVAS